MNRKAVLRNWVVEALEALGGSGSVLGVSKYVWEHHEDDLREAGDLFFTWQYDIRWAAQKLRHDGVLAAKHGKRSGDWRLAR